MSSDCSISLAGPAVEAAGRDLPPAPQARAVRKIVSRCQWRNWSNRFRCQLRPAQRRAFYPARLESLCNHSEFANLTTLMKHSQP